VTALFAEFSITNSPPGETARRNTGTAILLTDLIMPAGPALGGFCFMSRHFYRAEAGVLRFECSPAVGVARPG
jgi:hypothetical protein